MPHLAIASLVRQNHRNTMAHGIPLRRKLSYLRRLARSFGAHMIVAQTVFQDRTDATLNNLG
jgi:hypothetical protein